jgi:protein-S-isoprenylcysteine O-methyltransferase Ste14
MKESVIPMNAILTIIPLLLIRFGLLSILDKEALRRAAFFAPLIGKEKVAYLFYQVTNTLIIVYLCFLEITTDHSWLYAGAVIYGLGVLLCVISVVNYAKPKENGINLKGLYQISRNPMYVAYFIYYLGCVLLTRSQVLFVIVIIFQISVHWIIRSEERWCVQKFGEEYIDYMNKVRRYI